MLLLMKNKYRKQKGFSLLEALLAIVIIVAAGLGVVELFTSAQKKNKLKATEEVIQQTASATSQLLSTSNDIADVVTTQMVIDSGLLPSNVVVGGKSIVGPYGDVTVATDATYHNHYTVTTSLPGSQAVLLCQEMFRSAAITSTSGYIETLSGCSEFSKDSSNNDTSISLSFPREEYINTVAA